MVVAVALVRVVQAPVDEVVDVVPVGHGVVSAAFAMDVLAALMGGIAAVRVEFVHRQLVLVDVVAVGVVQVAVVKEVDMPVVHDLRVAAAGAVDVVVGVVDVACVAHVRDGTPPERQAPSRW